MARIPTPVEMTMEVGPGAAGLSVAWAGKSTALGGAVTKKRDGKFSVTLVGPAPPAVVLKVNVAARPVARATRSAVATLNVTSVTKHVLAAQGGQKDWPDAL